MAKINPILAHIRGKLAGVVFARGPFGPYIRQKVTPVNPQSNRQNTVRGHLGTLASNFSQLLTSAQQSGWKDYADNTPLTNVFGNQKILSALNMYTRANMIRLDAGLSALADAPVIFGEAPLAMNEPTADPSNEFILVNSTSSANPSTLYTTDVNAATGGAFDDGSTGEILQVQISPRQSPAVNFYAGPFNNSITFLVSDAATNELIIPIGAVVDVGDVYFARYRFVDNTGRVSPFRILRYEAINLP